MRAFFIDATGGWGRGETLFQKDVLVLLCFFKFKA